VDPDDSTWQGNRVAVSYGTRIDFRLSRWTRPDARASHTMRHELSHCLLRWCEANGGRQDVAAAVDAIGGSEEQLADVLSEWLLNPTWQPRPGAPVNALLLKFRPLLTTPDPRADHSGNSSFH
jgi:hypothetical protein